MSRKHDIEYIKDKAKDYGITIISDMYQNNEALLDIICMQHKDKGIQKRSWGNIITKKYPCKYCAIEKVHDLQNKTHDDFISDICEYKNFNIQIIGEYTDNKTKIGCLCNKCGRKIYLRPDHIKRGIGCGKCNKSLGEQRVEKYLLDNNIKYEKEYRFGDCIRNIKDMPFDFYLQNLNIAIEYDGRHHNKPSELYGQNHFIETKLNDEFKTKYCDKNGIKLIRIPCSEFNNIKKYLDIRIER